MTNSNETTQQSVTWATIMHDTFMCQYVDTMLWAEVADYPGMPEGSDASYTDAEYDVTHFAPETIQRVISDCEKFVKIAGEMIEGEESSAGHDFWLTRAEHGAGFWDGDWEENGDALDAIVKENFPNLDLYVGDDGLIYFSG